MFRLTLKNLIKNYIVLFILYKKLVYQKIYFFTLVWILSCILNFSSIIIIKTKKKIQISIQTLNFLNKALIYHLISLIQNLYSYFQKQNHDNQFPTQTPSMQVSQSLVIIHMHEQIMSVPCTIMLLMHQIKPW